MFSRSPGARARKVLKTGRLKELLKNTSLQRQILSAASFFQCSQKFESITTELHVVIHCKAPQAFMDS